MARRSAICSNDVLSSGFFETLDNLTKEDVDAFAPVGRRTLGRTAEALDKLKIQTQKVAFEEGYVAGVEAGRVEGLELVEAEMRDSTNEFAELLQAKADQAIFAIREWLVVSEQNLAELAVAIAARVLAQEVKLPSDTITELVKEALTEIRLAETARIRINPFDHAALMARKSELLAVSHQLRDVEIVEDPSILGGCVIESDAGIIDATIQTRLDLAMQSIREAA